MIFLFEALRPLLIRDQRRGSGKASQRRAQWNGKFLRIDCVKPLLYPPKPQQEEMAAEACRNEAADARIHITTTHHNDP